MIKTQTVISLFYILGLICIGIFSLVLVIEFCCLDIEQIVENKKDYPFIIHKIGLIAMCVTIGLMFDPLKDLIICEFKKL